MKYIAFVCGHNSGRSQMAQAFFNYAIKDFSSIDGKYEAISAGTRHGDAINPLVFRLWEKLELL